MNNEIKTQWVEALRSGKYRQGKRLLHTRRDGIDYFCCLGVLCDIMNIPRSETHGVNAPAVFLYGEERAKCYLPREVEEAANIHPNPTIPAGAVRLLTKMSMGVDGVSLADLNDDDLTFNEIADLIEEYL